MNARQFFDCVAQMRDAQRKYFRTRSHDDLVQAKVLESTIDREIERVQKIVNNPYNQLSIDFGSQ